MNKETYNQFKNLFPIIIQRLDKKILLEAQNKIHSGYLLGHTKNKIDDINIKTIEDWDKTLLLSESEQWHFHTLQRGFGILLNQRIVSSNLEVIKKNILMWNEWNNKTTTKGVQVWSGHTVALRLDFLAGCFISFEDNKWLEDIIDSHIHFLEQSINYDGNWNHGLDQNIALLKASYLRNNFDTLKIAYARALENFTTAFDEEGVNNEQSVTYHHYNIERFEHLKEIFKYLDLEFDDIDKTLEKANQFLLHALLPNGFYTPIGDSLYSKPMFKLFENYLIEFTRNKFLSPSYDISKVKIYKNGYVFGRSNWDIRKNPSHFSVRFGPARIIHGHNDHMSITFFANGKLVLNDGGFNGYQNDFYRNYFRHPKSHNVVCTTDNNIRFKWDATTELFEDKTLDDNSKIFRLKDNPYEETVRTRDLFIDVDENLIICFDSIVAKVSREYLQNWNFYPDFNVKYKGNGFFKIEDGSSIYTLYNSSKSNRFKIVKGHTDIENGKITNKGGFFGVGHNDTKECYSVQSTEAGTDVNFLSIFSEDPIEILVDNNQEVLFSCANTKIYEVQKQNFLINKYYIIDKFKLSNRTEEYYSINDNIAHFKNNTDERNKVTINLINNLSDYILINIKLLNSSKNFSNYFYLSGLEGKLRFGEYYLIKKENYDLNMTYFVNENTNIECSFCISKITNSLLKYDFNDLIYSAYYNNIGLNIFTFAELKKLLTNKDIASQLIEINIKLYTYGKFDQNKFYELITDPLIDIIFNNLDNINTENKYIVKFILTYIRNDNLIKYYTEFLNELLIGCYDALTTEDIFQICMNKKVVTKVIDINTKMKKIRNETNLIALSKVFDTVFNKMNSNEIVKAKDNIKVAVCVSGQLRGYEKAFENWKRYLISDNIKLDFYYHVWSNIGRHFPETKNKVDRTFKGEIAKELKEIYSEYDYQEIKNLFTNLYEMISSGSNLVSKHDIFKTVKAKDVVVEDDMHEPFNSYTNSEKMYYKIYKAHEAALNSNINYDLYIRIRPDCELNCFLDLIEINNYLSAHSNFIFADSYMGFKAGELRVGDQMAIGKKESMGIYSRVWIDNLNNCKELSMEDKSFKGHQSLAIQCALNNVFVKSGTNRGKMAEPSSPKIKELLAAIKQDLIQNRNSKILKRLYNAALKDLEVYGENYE